MPTINLTQSPASNLTKRRLFACVCRQARWRQLRSCAGALQSITWAYRTRVEPFEPDALHPNAEDDQAEQVLHTALVEWRKELSAGADLNNTTLRKHFPEYIFKHNQHQPKAGSWSQRFAKTNLFWTEGLLWRNPLSWTRAGREWIETERATKAKLFEEQIEKAQSTAYCARFCFPFNRMRDSPPT